MAASHEPEHAIARFETDSAPLTEFLSYMNATRSKSFFYSREYFDWKLARNPFGLAAGYLRYRDGTAAAHCSIVAKPGNDAVAGGVAVGELGDTHTRPEFQRQGHFSAIGKHVIDDFGARAPGAKALIYGLPNEQALPGWTRSIGCDVMDLRISEMRCLPWTIRRVRARLAARRDSEQRLIKRDDAATAAAIDSIWSACDRSRWLLKKDSAWWRWRYRDSATVYETWLLQDGWDDSARAWLVTRTTPTRIRGMHRVVVCDVVGSTPEAEVGAFRKCLATVPGFADIIQGWFQGGTPLADEAARVGFAHVRSVPVIFAQNDAYRQFRTATQWFRLAIGDTDNV